jgi:hypothetical protein
MYEDYLENFVFKTAEAVAMKLFGRVKHVSPPQVEESDIKNNEEESNDKNNEVEEKEDEEDSNEPSEQTSGAANQLSEIDKNEKQARADYEAINGGLSEINFHFPLFLLLLVITCLSVPSVVTWARNFHVSKVLASDPYLLHATGVISALGFIWQMKTPRNV